MKGISLWQPYASLWMAGVKKFETRGWRCAPGSTIWVHASKTTRGYADVGVRLHEICVRSFGSEYADTLPRGALLGTLKVSACISAHEVAMSLDGPAEDGDELAMGLFTHGRWAWWATNRKALRAPIPYTGRQSLFEVDVPPP